MSDRDRGPSPKGDRERPSKPLEKSRRASLSFLRLSEDPTQISPGKYKPLLFETQNGLTEWTLE